MPVLADFGKSSWCQYLSPSNWAPLALSASVTFRMLSSHGPVSSWVNLLCMYVYVCVTQCVYMCVCVCIYIYIYIHTVVIVRVS